MAPTPEQYAEMAAAVSRLVGVANKMYPDGGADVIKTVCVAAIESEIAEQYPVGN